MQKDRDASEGMGARLVPALADLAHSYLARDAAAVERPGEERKGGEAGGIWARMRRLPRHRERQCKGEWVGCPPGLPAEVSSRGTALPSAWEGGRPLLGVRSSRALPRSG